MGWSNVIFIWDIGSSENTHLYMDNLYNFIIFSCITSYNYSVCKNFCFVCGCKSLCDFGYIVI
ncbi:hypothetical protein Hdeb2414_s0004g00133841 [Helianthus debilis subsp. tardiflorus]